MRGITRAAVMQLCEEQGLPLQECDFYLTQVSKPLLLLLDQRLSRLMM
jgi:hypothetical protein